jgi:hypothetical protein
MYHRNFMRTFILHDVVFITFRIAMPVQEGVPIANGVSGIRNKNHKRNSSPLQFNCIEDIFAIIILVMVKATFIP